MGVGRCCLRGQTVNYYMKIYISDGREGVKLQHLRYLIVLHNQRNFKIGNEAALLVLLVLQPRDLALAIRNMAIGDIITAQSLAIAR